MKKHNKDFVEETKEVITHLENYGAEMPTDLFKFTLQVELSDILFRQHMSSKNSMNLMMISVQLFLCILTLVCLIFNIKISITTAIINIILLLLVLFNNYIHTKSWNTAKKRLDLLDKAFNMFIITSKSETITELQNRFNINFNDMLNKEDMKKIKKEYKNGKIEKDDK